MFFFFFQAEDGIRDDLVTGVQTCALPICQCIQRMMSAGGRIAFFRNAGTQKSCENKTFVLKNRICDPILVEE